MKMKKAAAAASSSPSSSTMGTVTPPPPPLLSSVLSQETLRERILTGGGGVGNVRLSKVASLYADFRRALQQQQLQLPSSSTSADGVATTAAAATIAAQHALQTELNLHDLEMHKLLLSSRACDGNSSRHDASLTQMESILESTRNDIQNLSSTLTAERQIKHNLEEYNALAKLGNINKHSHNINPPICVTKLELEQVQQSIQNVNREIEQAQSEIMVREKQLRVVMASLGDLRSTLMEEEVLKKRRQQEAVELEEGESVSSSTQGGTTGQNKRKRMSNNGTGDEIGAL